jgi:hypothetical protein
MAPDTTKEAAVSTYNGDAEPDVTWGRGGIDDWGWMRNPARAAENVGISCGRSSLGSPVVVMLRPLLPTITILGDSA